MAFAINPAWWGKMIAAGLLGSTGAAHIPGFRREYLNLFRAIREEQNTTAVQASSSTYQEIHYWDAVIAQTMLENGVTTIYTENTKDFSKIKGINAVNPLK